MRFVDSDALSSKLLITRQQFIMQLSFSRGALKALIFCSSFAANWKGDQWLFTVDNGEK